MFLIIVSLSPPAIVLLSVPSVLILAIAPIIINLLMIKGLVLYPAISSNVVESAILLVVAMSCAPLIILAIACVIDDPAIELSPNRAAAPMITSLMTI